ncbi:MAG: hypothetical protein ACOY3P_01550 [Planctomycetota bacterium]
MEAVWPSYLALIENGELHRRAGRALEALSECAICPRACHVDRRSKPPANSFCRSGRFAAVSSALPHLGEEDCLRGWCGSGTIFFSQCNLRCDFCQNYDVSTW